MVFRKGFDVKKHYFHFIILFYSMRKIHFFCVAFLLLSSGISCLNSSELYEGLVYFYSNPGAMKICCAVLGMNQFDRDFDVMFLLDN